jgi:O-antigen biosynthesis protein WbqP
MVTISFAGVARPPRSYLCLLMTFTKRLFDIVLSLLALAVLIIPMGIIAVATRLTSPGPVLYWSKRIGRNRQVFEMPKFRSMRTDTPEVATHLLPDPDSFITPIGARLRQTSLDELPQLWSILMGDMSFVGPRPALYNQQDLIDAREAAGVNALVPGLTGWAQVNGRDELPIPTKVEFDRQYLVRQSLAFDLHIIWLTALRVLRRTGVSH